PEAACPVPLAPGESVVVETDRASELSSLGLATLPTLAVSGLVEGWRGVVFVLGLMALGWALYWLLVRTDTDWVLDEDAVRAKGWRGKRVGWSDVLGYGDDLERSPMTQRKMVLLTRRGRLVTKPPMGQSHAVRRSFERWQAERLARAGGVARHHYFPSMRRAGGLAVGDEGLWLVRRWGSRRIGWDQVQGVRWYRQAAGLALAGGRGVSLLDYLGAQDLAVLVDARLGGPRPTTVDGKLVSAQAIERWLGVPPGGAVVCRPKASALALVAGVFVLTALAVVTGLQGKGWGMLAQGLTVGRRGRRRRVPWSDVEARLPGVGSQVIDTAQGPIRLPFWLTHRDALAGIVDRLIEARSGGLKLPGAAPIPDAALSRLTGVERSTDDRALSISERQAEPCEHD
ncbi:MAG: hypothetical protein HZB16_14855, partial [Armatimonadetes bacterium]|nr:hypothetical protein [Armatimonadota bacterium]